MDLIQLTGEDKEPIFQVKCHLYYSPRQARPPISSHLSNHPLYEMCAPPGLDKTRGITTMIGDDRLQGTFRTTYVGKESQ